PSPTIRPHDRGASSMDSRHLVARTTLLLTLAGLPRPGEARAEGPPPLEAPDEGPAARPGRTPAPRPRPPPPTSPSLGAAGARRRVRGRHPPATAAALLLQKHAVRRRLGQAGRCSLGG